MEKKYTDAQRRANKKQRAKKDGIYVYLPRGFSAVVKYHASIYEPQRGEPSKAGYSPKGNVSAFVYRAIQATMEADAQAAKEAEKNKGS